jgi:hypothetical protein
MLEIYRYKPSDNIYDHAVKWIMNECNLERFLQINCLSFSTRVLIRKKLKVIKVYQEVHNNNNCPCSKYVTVAYSRIAWQQTYVSPALKFAGRRKGRKVGLMKMLSKRCGIRPPGGRNSWLANSQGNGLWLVGR